MEELRRKPRCDAKADFVVIGCGLQGRGMGWFHALQLHLGECPSASLRGVVEPWFLKDGEVSEPFQAVTEQLAGVRFQETCEGLFAGPRSVALIAGRTACNPQLFREAVAQGASHVLLEKPGAETAEELQSMAQKAQAAKVPVYMGFIKSLSAYVTQALPVITAHPRALVTLISRNSYQRDDLEEVFARCAEGLLKNMVIHELALAVQFFGMTVGQITKVQHAAAGCEWLSLGNYSDFSKVDFTVTNCSGRSLRIVADRCSGAGSCLAVTEPDGRDVYRQEMVDDAADARVNARMAENPGWLSYLITQEPEYRELKERCARAALEKSVPENVASIEVAIEALRLAEYLQPLLRDMMREAPT